MEQYHLQLTGNVGGSQFNARLVRNVLGQYPGKHVDILIDSFGGSLPEGLSICGALRDHGDVTVHFRGMSASAATIASMGAKRVSIAQEAMYLVHKASMEFFDWASRNADQLEDFIEALKSTKDDLDTIDRSMAELYAGRCKRPAKDLLELMKNERWLTAKEALEWGFVDEISGTAAVVKPSLTKAQAAACTALGHPLPPVAVESEQQGFVRSLVEAMKRTALELFPALASGKEAAGNDVTNFNSDSNYNSVSMKNPISAAAGGEPAAGNAASGQASGQASGNGEQSHVTCGQSSSGQGAGEACGTTASAQGAGEASGDGAGGAGAVSMESLTARLNALEQENKGLRDEISALKGITPGAKSQTVVAQPTPADAKRTENSKFADFARTSASARKLFNSLP